MISWFQKSIWYKLRSITSMFTILPMPKRKRLRTKRERERELCVAMWESNRICVWVCQIEKERMSLYKMACWWHCLISAKWNFRCLCCKTFYHSKHYHSITSLCVFAIASHFKSSPPPSLLNYAVSFNKKKIVNVFKQVIRVTWTGSC